MSRGGRLCNPAQAIRLQIMLFEEEELGTFWVILHKLYKQPPDYQFLKPFGCCCFPYLRPYSSNKLEPRSQPCIFLGYSSGTKGFRCLEPVTKKVYLSRHVNFFENDFPYFTLTIPSSLPQSTPFTVMPSFTIPPSASLSFPASSSLSPPSSHSHSFSSNSSSPIVSSSPVIPSSSIVVPSSNPVVTSSTPVFPSSTSSPPIASHPMITRSKNGITVPKLPFSLTIQGPPVTEPVSFKFKNLSGGKQWTFKS